MRAGLGEAGDLIAALDQKQRRLFVQDAFRLALGKVRLGENGRELFRQLAPRAVVHADLLVIDEVAPRNAAAIAAA